MEALGQVPVGARASWFETRGVAALLTTRVERDLILRSIAK
jgi:hypothetical protein